MKDSEKLEYKSLVDNDDLLCFSSEEHLLNNQIKDNLKGYLDLDVIERPIIIFPDLHLKEGESSPTGIALVTKNHIIPGATHLAMGSGIATWMIDLKKDEIDFQLIKNLFTFLDYILRYRKDDKGNSFAVEINPEYVDKIFQTGANIAVENNWCLDEELAFIEREGNFLSKAPTDYNCLEAIPDCVKEVAYTSFGCTTPGNGFIELQEAEDIYDHGVAELWGIEKGQLFLVIHGGIAENGLFNMHFIPRWGLRGDQFIPFEKEKWAYHSKHLYSKENMRRKHNYFPPSLRSFAIPYDSEDGQVYMAAHAALQNYSVVVRLWLGHTVDMVLRTLLGHNKKMTRLLWDSLHDSIQFVDYLSQGKRFLHRHGSNVAFRTDQFTQNHLFSKTGQPVIIPGCIGMGSIIGKTLDGVDRTYNSINHGVGRIVERPVARKLFNKEDLIQRLEMEECFFINKSKFIEGEHQGAFRPLDEVVNEVSNANLMKKVVKLKTIAVIKG